MPRRNTKRAFNSSTDPGFELDPSLELSSYTTQSIPLKSASVQRNLTGFSALPPELLEKINEYLLRAGTGSDSSKITRIDSLEGDYMPCFAIWRALSQTCYYLRLFYLPLLWERFDVCAAYDFGEARFRELAGQALEQRGKGMLESTHLWPYVRIVTLSFTEYRTHVVLPQLAKMLQSLFNVHTLKVYYTHPTISSALKDAFKGRHLASIRTVVMPNYAYEVLRRCQGVEHITCTHGDGGKLAAAVVEAGCSSLQVLQYISPTPAILKRLKKANPPLRCVRVKPHVPGKSEEAVIRDWADFPLLRTIEIQCSEDKLDALKLVKVAKEVLRTCAEREHITELKTPRRSRVDVQEAQSASIDLGTDLRVVKVRYAPGYNYSWSQPDGPIKIDEFPL